MKVRNFSRILLVVVLIVTQGLLGMNQSKKNELKVSPRAKKVAFGTLGVLGAIALGALLLHNFFTNNKEAPASPSPAPAFSPPVPASPPPASSSSSEPTSYPSPPSSALTFFPVAPDFLSLVPSSGFYPPGPEWGQRLNQEGVKHVLNANKIKVDDDRISILVNLGRHSINDHSYGLSLSRHLNAFKYKDLVAQPR
jgi:hypothetical protein